MDFDCLFSCFTIILSLKDDMMNQIPYIDTNKRSLRAISCIMI